MMRTDALFAREEYLASGIPSWSVPPQTRRLARGLRL